MQRLLSEGQFTATYKFAFLLALADISVEHGTDSASTSIIPTSLVAEKFIYYYWRHVMPYMPASATNGIILQQNTRQQKQAEILTLLVEARRLHGHSLPALQRQNQDWRKLVRSVEAVVCRMPLWKLQRVGSDLLDFLYEQREHGREIQLKPGVAHCLRYFHVLITHLVRGSWLQYIRRYNGPALGDSTDLEEFLFGSERADLAALRPALMELQKGRCFYCDTAVRSGGQADHFVPWARYPVDFGHNFVLADAGCNNKKRMMLAAEEHLARWSERNAQHATGLDVICSGVNLVTNLHASIQVARWAYGHAFLTGSLVWVQADKMRHLGPTWMQALPAV